MHPVEERINCVIANQDFGHFSANRMRELHREGAERRSSATVRAELAVEFYCVVVRGGVALQELNS